LPILTSLVSTQLVNKLIEAMLVHVSGLSARIVTSPLTLGKRVTSQLPNLPPELRYIYYSKYFGLCVVPNICQVSACLVLVARVLKNISQTP